MSCPELDRLESEAKVLRQRIRQLERSIAVEIESSQAKEEALKIADHLVSELGTSRNDVLAYIDRRQPR